MKGRHSKMPASSGDDELVTLAIQVSRRALTVQAPEPRFVSQHNCETYCGLTRGVFLQLIRAHGFPLPVVVIGKTRAVAAREFCAWLQAQTTKPPLRGVAVAPHQRARDGVDEFLDELGLRRVAGGAR